jgi:hypothetical protein
LVQKHRLDCLQDIEGGVINFAQIDAGRNLFSFYVDLLKDEIVMLLLGNIETVMIEYHMLGIFALFVKRMGIDNIFPMFSISDLDEGIGVYADVMLIDAVIVDDFVVDEFF